MLHVYVLMLAETGMRCDSEALYLRWEDISLETGQINVVSGREGHRTKTGEGRLVPISSRLAGPLKDHFRGHRLTGVSEYVFFHQHASVTVRVGDRIASMRRAFASAAKRAGIRQGFRQHDLRHRACTEWLAAGTPTAIVQKAMGHSRLETTERYWNYLPEHFKQIKEPVEIPGSVLAQA